MFLCKLIFVIISFMKKKILFLFAILILSIFTIVSFLFLNRSSDSLTDLEKEQAMAKILGRKPQDDSQVPLGDTVYNGKYISFKYPLKAKIYTQKVNSTPLPALGIEYFSFDLENPRMIFSMDVIDVVQSVDPLGDYPSVKLRELQNNSYVKKDVFADDIRGVLYDKYSNSFEKTAFFYFNGNIFAISVQGNDKKAVEALFDKVINSTKFL